AIRSCHVWRRLARHLHQRRRARVARHGTSDRTQEIRRRRPDVIPRTRVGAARRDARVAKAWAVSRRSGQEKTQRQFVPIRPNNRSRADPVRRRYYFRHFSRWHQRSVPSKGTGQEPANGWLEEALVKRRRFGQTPER